MFSSSRADSGSPFPDRPLFSSFRSMPRRKAHRYRCSPSPRQLAALGRPALGVGCLVVLAGCGESLVPDPPLLTVGPPVAASVVPGGCQSASKMSHLWALKMSHLEGGWHGVVRRSRG